MSKSLAERIGEHTNLVMEKRAVVRKQACKEKVFGLLKAYVIEQAQKSDKLFNGSRKDEICIPYEEVLKTFHPGEREYARTALRDIGIRSHIVPINSNTSIEVQELLKVYEEMFHKVLDVAEMQSTADCETVLNKLESQDYEIVNVNKVTVKVHFSSNINNPYASRVKEQMRKNGFAVDIAEDHWDISVIQEKGD